MLPARENSPRVAHRGDRSLDLQPLKGINPTPRPAGLAIIDGFSFITYTAINPRISLMPCFSVINPRSNRCYESAIFLNHPLIDCYAMNPQSPKSGLRMEEKSTWLKKGTPQESRSVRIHRQEERYTLKHPRSAFRSDLNRRTSATQTASETQLGTVASRSEIEADTLSETCFWRSIKLQFVIYCSDFTLGSADFNC
ncbi:hypothetical protein LXL04_031565 [Taraxacum kok-saghyz]